MGLRSDGRTRRGGGRALGLAAALCAAGTPAASVPGWADDLRRDDMAEVAACAPQGVIRDRVAALGEGGLRLAGGALATFPALRLEGAATAWLARSVARPGGGNSRRRRAGPLGPAAGRCGDGGRAGRRGTGLAGGAAGGAGARRRRAASRRPLRPAAAGARAGGAAHGQGPLGGGGQPAGGRGRFARLNALAGRYALVEGRISAVSTRGRTVYVNFGRRWREDFTVMVAARDRRAFAQAGMELAGMVGETVRVRGHIEARGGPAIEAQTPDQIERLEAAK